jgi:hypothetical protein
LKIPTVELMGFPDEDVKVREKLGPLETVVVPCV